MDERQQLGSVVPGRVVREVGLYPVGREVELAFRIDSGFGSNSLPAQEILFWNSGLKHDVVFLPTYFS